MASVNNRQPLPLFSSLLESCFRFRFYSEVVETSMGRAMWFLTLLAVISAVSFTAYFHQIIYPRLLKASDRMPMLSIKNGKVAVESTDKPEPFATVYSDPEKLLRIDLDLRTAEEKRTITSDCDYTAVITKYSIVIKRPVGGELVIGYPYGYNLDIRKHSLRSTLESWQWLILLVIFLLSLAAFWVAKLAHAFVLTIPGLLLWGMFRRDLTYGKLFMLCIYVLAPPTLFSILLQWLNAEFALPRFVIEYQLVIYLLIGVEYLLGGMIMLQSNGSPKKDADKYLTERMI